MKTTNYKISKQLAEIGFKQRSTIGWFTSKCGGGGRFNVPDGIKSGYNLECYSFDLETILEALPKEIKKLHFWATWSTSSDCYIFGYIDGIVRNTELETATEENESLADTAAKLWLKLKKEGLV